MEARVSPARGGYAGKDREVPTEVAESPGLTTLSTFT